VWPVWMRREGRLRGATDAVIRGLVWLLAMITLAIAVETASAAPATPSKPLVIEAFVREGCPHCEDAERFLSELGREHPELKIVIRDVRKDPAALDRLKQIALQRMSGAPRVPAILVNGQLIVGFSLEASTDKLIRSAVAGIEAARAAATLPACEAEDLACERAPAPPTEAFEVSLFGRTLTLEDVGLPAFTLAMGLLDGFNPCSMWVLLLMISLLAPLNDRRRMFAIAGTFVLIQGIAYFLFMTAWLNLFLFIGLSRASQLAIAAIAIAAGLINMKDFFAFGRGISLSIPERAKPGIYNRMRAILHAESLPAAIVGAVILACLVQIVEFLCTSGFPALFTRILTLRAMDPVSYYGYLLLYISAYMLDDVVILTIGVVLLSRHRLQEREGRWLKLVSGLVMVGLGIYLIFA
jgi:glutaredoxin